MEYKEMIDNIIGKTEYSDGMNWYELDNDKYTIKHRLFYMTHECDLFIVFNKENESLLFYNGIDELLKNLK